MFRFKFEKIINFLPLIIFSYSSLWYGKSSVGNDFWKYPFFLGSIAASLKLLCFYYKKRTFDYLVLGADLFLIGGGIGFLLMGVMPHSSWVHYILLPYKLFGQSVIFFFICCVGSITSFTSSTGFAQIPASKVRVNIGSLLLTAVSLATFFISLVVTRGYNTGRLGVIPLFIGLFFFRNSLQESLLKRRYKKNEL